MDSVTEEIEKELDKQFEKKKPLQRRSLLLISVLALAITVLASLHEFNESWAWEIANALITVNGFVLGFTIVGVTLFSERAFTRRRMINIFTEYIDDIWKDWKGILKEAKVEEPAIRDKLEKSIRSMLLSAMVDIHVLPLSMLWAVASFLVSIGCALSLFGVSDTTASIPLLREVFWVVFYISIYGLITGIFLIYKGLEDITTRIPRKEIFEAVVEVIADKGKKETKETEK